MNNGTAKTTKQSDQKVTVSAKVPIFQKLLLKKEAGKHGKISSVVQEIISNHLNNHPKAA